MTASVSAQAVTATALTSTQTPVGQPTKYFLSAGGVATGKNLQNYDNYEISVEFFSVGQGGAADSSLGTQTVNLGPGSGARNYTSAPALEITPAPPVGQEFYVIVSVKFVKPANGGNDVAGPVTSAKVKFR